MPKTKTTSSKKSSSKSLGFNPKFKFNRKMLMVIAAVVVAAGGYLFYRGTHAADFPPYYLLGFKYPATFTTSPDGLTQNSTTMRCSKLKVATPYGTAARCAQSKQDAQGAWSRDVIYNASAGVFAVNGSWAKRTAIGANPPITPQVCKNDGNSYTIIGEVSTSVGALAYGQQYHYGPNPGQWQVRWANIAYGNCTAITGWMNIVDVWI